MGTNSWAAIGAIGQWLSAIATFAAVLVALKPFKRGMVVKLSRLEVKLGEERHVFPLQITLYNYGYKDINIASWGVCDSKLNVVIEDISHLVKAESTINLSLKEKSFIDAVSVLEGKKFQIWIKDINGKQFHSKRYTKNDFKERDRLRNSFQ